jgi:nucleoside-diphosphate-sugar epimerase
MTALVNRRIVVHNPDLWRPLIDVEDASAAYICAIEAHPEVTGTFNIAHRNYRLVELAPVVAAELKRHGIQVEIQTEHKSDVRSYRVDTTKASVMLNFTAHKPLETTVRELVEWSITRSAGDLSHSRYYNIRELQRLAASGSLEAKLGTAGTERITSGVAAR